MTWECKSNDHPKQLGYENTKNSSLINKLTFTFQNDYLQAVFYINKNASDYSKFNKKLGLFGFALDIQVNGVYVVNLGSYEKTHRLFKLINKYVPFSESELAKADAFFTRGFLRLNTVPASIPFVTPSCFGIMQVLLQKKKPIDPPLPPAPDENSLSLIQQAQLLVSGSYDFVSANYNSPTYSNSEDKQSKVESAHNHNSLERKTAYRR